MIKIKMNTGINNAINVNPEETGVIDIIERKPKVTLERKQAVKPSSDLVSGEGKLACSLKKDRNTYDCI